LKNRGSPKPSQWSKWHHMTSCDIMWHHMMSYDVMWQHLRRSLNTSSLECDRLTKLGLFDITWYHVMSYDMIWYHMISYDSHCDEVWTRSAALWSANTIVHLWYDMIWYYIIRCHMISYDTLQRKKRSTALPSNDQYMEINIIIWCYMTSHDII
jgi:hypothetical protein